MSATDFRPARTTPVLRLPVPGDLDAADAPSALGALADRIEELLSPSAPAPIVPPEPEPEPEPEPTPVPPPESGAAGESLLWQPGDIKCSAAVNPTTGWLVCTGAAVARAAFPALFAAIGVTYGSGDGSTTFNLPNLSGRFPLGRGTRPLGAVGGAETHVLAAGEMPVHGHAVTEPSHSHTISDPGHGHGVSQSPHTHGISQSPHAHGIGAPYSGSTSPATGSFSGAGHAGSSGAANANITLVSANANLTLERSGTGITVAAGRSGITLGNAGGGGAHNNLPPFQALNYFIKT